MKRLVLLLSLPILLISCDFWKPNEPAVNPDPNHTHADFAVWIDNVKLDFSGDEFMSTAPAEGTESEEGDHQHEYLHLHDNIGHVIHRHKPGLSIGEFLSSIGYTFTPTCLIAPDGTMSCSSDEKTLQMFVNGSEVPVDPAFVFNDVDKILLTYGSTPEQIQQQLTQMTDDACLYSRTCPERGEPPAENCVADPKVPCVVPEEE